MVEADDEHRCAEDVGEQDELLPLLVGDVAGLGQEFDAGQPLVLGQPDVDDEGVQMADERVHENSETIGRRVVEAGPDSFRQARVTEVARR